jgi:hypothetical protein
MSDSTRRLILRANAVFLILAGGISFLLDLRAYFFQVGPSVRLIAPAPHTVIGFVEAHGLALILGILFARAAVARPWHWTAAAVHVLLGGSNLLFWQSFVAGDMLAVGYVTTAFHGLFVVLEVAAALGSPKANPRESKSLRIS